MSTNYSKRQGTSAIRGQLYETKLLSLINFRFLHYDGIERFHLATNVDKIGSFDDICFVIKLRGVEKPFFVFIQAKHKENVKRLYSYKTDMIKNFKSYLAIRYKFKPQQKDDELFKGNFDESQCLFIMYSNAENELTELDTRTFVDTLDELIGTGTGGIVKKPPNTAEDVKYLCKIVINEQINELAVRMVKYIKGEIGFQYMLSDELMRRYHVIMGQKVLIISDIVDIHDPHPHRMAEFQKEFFDNNEEHIVLFREALYTQILKKRKLTDDDKYNLTINFLADPLDVITLSKLVVTVITYNNGQLQLVKNAPSSLNGFRQKLKKVYVPELTVNEAIEMAAKEILTDKKSIEFKVPILFGNVDLAMTDRVTKKLGDILEKSENKEINIDDGFMKRYGGIASAIGNLLVLDKNPKYMKFTDNCRGYAKTVFEKLNERIENLDDYKFNFKVRLIPKLSFECSLHEEHLASDFLNKLLFFTNQSDEAGVGKQLKKEIEDEQHNHVNHFLVNTEAIYLRYHKEIQTWWMTAKEAPYLTKNSKKFENVIDDIFKDRLMSHVTYMTNINKTKCMNYTFKENAVKCIKLQQQTQNILIAENCDMLLAKVTQYLKHLKEAEMKKLSLKSNNTCEKQIDDKKSSTETKQTGEILSDNHDQKLSSDANDTREILAHNHDKKLSCNETNTCGKQFHDTKSPSETNTIENQISDNKPSSESKEMGSSPVRLYDKKSSTDTKNMREKHLDSKKPSSERKVTGEKGEIHDKKSSSKTKNNGVNRTDHDKKQASNINSMCEKQMKDKKLLTETKITGDILTDDHDKKLSPEGNSMCEKQTDSKKPSSPKKKGVKLTDHDQKLSSETAIKCEKELDNKNKLLKKNLKGFDLEYLVLDLKYILKLLPNEFKALSAELSSTKDKKLLIFVCDEIQNNEHAQRLKSIAKAIVKRNLIVITNNESIDIVQKHFIETSNVVSDDKHSITDLTAESQNFILGNAKVTFQGKELSLDQILDGESMKYVTGDVLKCVIQQQTVVVGKAIDYKQYHKTTYLDGRIRNKENGAYVKTFHDLDDDVVIITAKPGMGKSTLLTHLSLETKKIDPKVWIVRINLLEHSSKLSHWKNANTNLDTLKFMCHVLLHEKFGKKHEVQISLEEVGGVVQLKDGIDDQWTMFELKLFLHFYNRKRIIFLFDGFDEIYSYYKNEVLECIETVKDCPQKHKIWITSRSYNEIVTILRKKFGLEHEMESLSYSERSIYLEKFWKLHLELKKFDEEQLDNVYHFIKYMSESENRELRGFEFERLLHEIYVSAGLYLVNEIKHTHIPLWKYERNNDDSYHIEEITDMYTEILSVDGNDGTPLLLHLTADYFLNLLKSKGETIKWNLDINTFDIYDKYLEKKLKIRVEEKYGADICMPDSNKDYNDKLGKLILKHKQLGAYAIYREFSEKLFTKKELKKIINTIKYIEKADEETGHICNVANGMPIFAHMTFTEYYAVGYICDVLKNGSCKDKQKSMLDFIFNVVFASSYFRNVHRIFDHKLKTDLTLKNVLLCNKDTIFDILLEQGKFHFEFINGSRKKYQSSQGNKNSRFSQGKEKNISTMDSLIHQWALCEDISSNLRNFKSLLLSIFESNLNTQNLDVFLNILIGTNVYMVGRANVCNEFLIFILDFVRKNAKTKFDSMVATEYSYLRCLKNYEEMSSKEIIEQIQNEYMDTIKEALRPALGLDCLFCAAK